MTKQKISWKETWKIYWSHYIHVNKYTGFLLLMIYLPAAIIAKRHGTTLLHLLKQPHYGLPFITAILFIQLFPINLYVLRNKTLPKRYDGFSIEIKKHEEPVQE